MQGEKPSEVGTNTVLLQTGGHQSTEQLCSLPLLGAVKPELQSSSLKSEPHALKPIFHQGLSAGSGLLHFAAGTAKEVPEGPLRLKIPAFLPHDLRRGLKIQTPGLLLESAPDTSVVTGLLGGH